jgi:prepilin-type N-terminal cleavage/methylation domain-containing protein
MEGGGGRPLDGGFTFVEILVSLALLSVLSVALLAGLLNAQKLVGRIVREAGTSARVVQLDGAVRRSVRRVRVPFWVRQVEVEQGDGWLEVPYLDGDTGDRLTFRSREGWVLIGSTKGGTAAALGPFGGAAFELDTGEDGRPRGVRVVVDVGAAGAGERLVISARFGSSPF